LLTSLFEKIFLGYFIFFRMKAGMSSSSSLFSSGGVELRKLFLREGGTSFSGAEDVSCCGRLNKAASAISEREAEDECVGWTGAAEKFGLERKAAAAETGLGDGDSSLR
jgi:hypothetical protein